MFTPFRTAVPAMARSSSLCLIALATICGTHARAGAATLSNVFTSLPSISDDANGKAGATSNVSGGHAGLLTFELEDDFDAVQIGVVNQYTSPWALSRFVVAPSASYGGDPVIGQAAYDLDGKQLHDMLPVQWSHGGANSAPSGNPVLALPLATATAGGTALNFASTTAAAGLGGGTPSAGWSVADGLGCVPAGATVVAVTTTKVTLSAATTTGCKAGQDIYFSPAAFGAFGQAIPAASSFGELSVTFSDWLPVKSLPRTDGGFVTGEAVAGPAVAAGTTLSAVGYTSLTLSKPLTAALPAQAALTISTSAATAAMAPRGSVTIKLASPAGVRVGHRVSGSTALASGTVVQSITGDTVTLDRATKGVLPAGTALGFANTVWTSLPAAAGDSTVSVPSTSRRPLLHLRYFTAATGAPSVHAPGCVRNPMLDTLPCEAPLGLPPIWVSQGGQNTSRLPIDGVNFPSQIGGAAGGARGAASYPSIFIRYLGRHAGATVVICGGYQSAGATGTASGEAGPGRVGAAWASAQSPTVPVSIVSVASHQIDTGPDFDNCTRMIDLMQPSIALMQNYSNHNATSVTTYRTQLQAVAQHALSVGVQPVIYLAYVEASGHVGSIPVAAAVSNGTAVPLLTGIANPTSGSATLVTGPGIPDGTLTVPVTGSWNLALTKAVNIPAGSLISLSVQVSQDIGTFVTLTQPSFVTTSAALVTAPGAPSGASIALARGSYRGTLSQAGSIPGNTILGLANGPAASVANYTQAAQWFLGKTDPWDAVQLNGFGILGTDSANQNWLCNGCTIEGSYANDYGVGLIAAQFVPLLRQLTGQTP